MRPLGALGTRLRSAPTVTADIQSSRTVPTHPNPIHLTSQFPHAAVFLGTIAIAILSAPTGLGAQVFDVVVAFDGHSPDGRYPQTGLIATTEGQLYGTTSQGGPGGYGTVFRIDSGTFATVYGFTVSDGHQPNTLIEGIDGNLYGTTSSGGAADFGTVFKLDPAGVLT